MHRLYKLHILSFVLHATSGAIGFALTSNANIDIPVYGNYVSYNLNGQNAAAVFAKIPPVKVLSYNIVKALSAMEIITAAFQIFYIIELYKFEPHLLKTWSARPMRWVEYGITASILTLTNVVATGGNDIILLVVVIGSSVGLQACGFLSEYAWAPPYEKDENTVYKRNRIMNAVALVQGCVLLFTVVGAITAQLGENENVDAIWSEQIGAYSVYFSSFGINAALRACNVGPWKDFVWTETVYVVLSVCSKLSLFWMAASATRQILEDRQYAPRTAGVNWDAVRYSAMAFPGALGLMYLTTIRVRGSTDETFFGPPSRRLRL